MLETQIDDGTLQRVSRLGWIALSLLGRRGRSVSVAIDGNFGLLFFPQELGNEWTAEIGIVLIVLVGIVEVDTVQVVLAVVAYILVQPVLVLAHCLWKIVPARLHFASWCPRLQVYGCHGLQH